MKAKLLFRNEKKSSTVFYLYFDNFDKSIFSHVLRPIIGFELGYPFGLNIGCIYYNFDTRVMLNVYDDQGMDVLVLDELEREMLKAEFSDLLNSCEE